RRGQGTYFSMPSWSKLSQFFRGRKNDAERYGKSAQENYQKEVIKKQMKPIGCRRIIIYKI
ncbi:MAG TPA: hypothetical protein VEV83_21480, partial [Parafilimonas sp.]|nr:hypothetical protein [Parafilimonas sp.]